MIKYSTIYLVIGVFFMQPILSQAKAQVPFDNELDLENQKIDREIIVKGTDQFLFFSTKEKIKAELSSPPLTETWQEQSDPILWQSASAPVKNYVGNIRFSYGNRNFFQFATKYHNQIGKTLFALDFHHLSFSHIDIKQQKRNSAQADTNLFFATKSKLHKNYNLIFSFNGQNRHNRLPNFSAYEQLDKRAFTFSLRNEIFVTPYSQLLVDVKGNYAQGALSHATTTNPMQLGRAEFALRSHNLLKKMELDFFASAGYSYHQQIFESPLHNGYSFFSFMFKIPLWQTLAGKRQWQGNLVLEFGAGNFLKDYTALSRMVISGRLANWVSTFEVLFKKEYHKMEQHWLQHRYWVLDKAFALKKIEASWKNKIPLSENKRTKIVLQIENGANYFWKGKQFAWNKYNSIWQYSPSQYFSVYNGLGLLFLFSSVFSWSASATYDFSKPQVSQLAPLGFLTEFQINTKHWLFVLGYRLHGIRIDNALQKNLPMVHLLYSKLEWKINSRFSLTLRGSNLLNQKYQWLSPFFEPELTVDFGLSVRL